MNRDGDVMKAFGWCGNGNCETTLSFHHMEVFLKGF